MSPVLCIAALALCTGTAHAQTAVDFYLGAGAGYAPAYFGADKMQAIPSGRFSSLSAQIFGMSFGSKDGTPQYGFAPRGSVRFVRARKAADHGELAGLPDLGPALELGGGLSYDAENYRIFAVARQGFGGHQGQVAEIGADLKFAVGPNLTLKGGPRAQFGSERFMDSYFGISGTAAAASGFAPHRPEAGIVSTGIEITATYAMTPNWSLRGVLTHDVLRGDAARSPLVRDSRQSTIALTLARRISLGF